ncbi:MAG TPA: hypothetical protein VIV11_01900 [Kofleriaceae bacterium]
MALPLVACGGGGSTDIKGTLRFSDRSDAEISRLVNAASGSEGFQAQATAESYADPFEPSDPCPARAFSGDTGTITGGCTTQDGDALEGSITIKNPRNWCLVFDTAADWCDMEYEGNFAAPSDYTFDNFSITQSGFGRSFDGWMSSATFDGYIDMDIVSVQLDIGVRSDVYAETDDGRTIDINGSGVELIGVGGAKVDGSIGVSSTNQTSGSFTLDGADTLKVTMQNNCVTWRIEGTQRMFSTCP